MALPDVSPYKMSRVLHSDNFLTCYTATNETGHDYVITEFFPAYAVDREVDGTLIVSERFTEDFARDMGLFVQRCTMAMELRDSSLHSFVEVFERGGTAYMVRRACGMTQVSDYMGSQQMDYIEAYLFMRPLINILALCAEGGMLFNVKAEDFRVNSLRNIVLCSPPQWEQDFSNTIRQLARLYYRLVTGMDAPADGAPAPFSTYDLTIPGRVEAVIMDAITGEGLYGSVNDFARTLRVPFEERETSARNSGKGTMRAMLTSILVLVVVLGAAAAWLVYGGVQAYRHSTFWADPDIFASAELPEPPLRDFSAMALTHPRDGGFVLTGSIAYHEGFMYFRSAEGMMRRYLREPMVIPGAAQVLAIVEDQLHIEGVSPSFIVGDSTHLFFTCAQSGGRIYRVLLNGDELERISEDAALHLAVVRNHLFYVNADAGFTLYRFDTQTEEHQRVFNTPVFATLAVGYQLFFAVGLPGTPDSALYVLDMSAAEYTIIPLVSGVGHTIRVFMDTVFYQDVEGRVRSITPTGEHIGVHSRPGVKSFDIFFHMLVITEQGRHVPIGVNMNTGQEMPLSVLDFAAYVWAHDESVYAWDIVNPALLRSFELPMN
jgi:hypothetical protein